MLFQIESVNCPSLLYKLLIVCIDFGFIVYFLQIPLQVPLSYSFGRNKKNIVTIPAD